MSGRPYKKKRKSADSVFEEAVPALSSLVGIPAFGELAMSAGQREAFEREQARLITDGCEATELEPACVVRLDRYFPAVTSPSGLCRAEFSQRFGIVHEPTAAVGDWVVLRRPADHDKAVIEAILPRESDIARWKGGSRGRKQTLAANVDVVLIVQAVGGRPISCDRITRSAVIATDCGARPAIVLTKCDRASFQTLGTDVKMIQSILGPEVPLALTAAGADGADCDLLESLASETDCRLGIEGVRSLVTNGRVAIVLGESGAGKSTLLNALAGASLLGTGGVRMRDDAGRHTTVARRMVSIPGGGVIIDEPGLRSLPLVGHERGLARVFPEIATAARGCRFRDCTHTHEPGCAVLAARDEGRIPQIRLDAYLTLAAEMRVSAGSLDPDVVL